MDNHEIELSIIVVTWNAREYARQCLDSIGAQKEIRSTEIIVVDNASSDGTPELIGDRFPEASLVQNKTNEGFAKANNKGIEISRGRYICLINSDVVLPPDCLNRLYNYMERNPTTGVVGPRMLTNSGRVGRSYMRFPTKWNCFCQALGLTTLLGSNRWFGGFLMRDFDNEQTAEVDVLNGWFLMIRRNAFEAVGGLDERFFMYGEDIDWCYRYHQAGWKRVYFAGASALHYGGASSAAAPLRFYLEMQRANLQFWRKHHGAFGAGAYRLITGLHAFIRLVAYGLVSIAKGSKCPEAAAKVRRSIACILWLTNLKSGGQVTRS